MDAALWIVRTLCLADLPEDGSIPPSPERIITPPVETLLSRQDGRNPGEESLDRRRWGLDDRSSDDRGAAGLPPHRANDAVHRVINAIGEFDRRCGSAPSPLPFRPQHLVSVAAALVEDQLSELDVIASGRIKSGRLRMPSVLKCGSLMPSGASR